MTVSGREENDRVNGLRSGRSAALTGMVNEWSPQLYRFVARLVKQDADAEDVLQQTYAAVLGSLDRFQGSSDNLRSWVFTIAYRAAMDVLRGRRRMTPLEEIEIEAPAEPVDLETTRAELKLAFDALSPEEQSLVTLKYQDDFTNQEIARMLGLTSNHVGVLLYRAKQNLRKALP
jgi:RNA polymerase sigma-70 factor (ECF subfamily)